MEIGGLGHSGLHQKGVSSLIGIREKILLNRHVWRVEVYCMFVGERLWRCGAVFFCYTILWTVGCTKSGDPSASINEEILGSTVTMEVDGERSRSERHPQSFNSVSHADLSTPAQEFRIFDEVQLGPWMITLEETTLSQVRDMIGDGQIKYIDLDSHPFWRLCFVARDQVDEVFVVFESGIMGGPERAITGIHVVKGMPRYDTPCTEIPIASHAISIQGVLRLGMHRRNVREQLGTPKELPEPQQQSLEEYAQIDENTDYFERVTEINEPLDGGFDSYDVSNSAIATFHHDRLVGLAIWKVSTN